MDQLTSGLIYELFVNRSDILAFQKPDGQYAGNVKTNKDQWLEYIKQHLKGYVTLGSYALHLGKSKWICLDIDCKQDPEKGRGVADNLSFHLDDLNIPHSIEFSGKKGYHVWIFFEKPEIAHQLRSFAKWFLGIQVGYSKSNQSEFITHIKDIPVNIEIFPKQDQTDGIGSLVKIPMGKHRNTGAWSRFLKFKYDYAEIEYLQDLYSNSIKQKNTSQDIPKTLTAGEMNIYRALNEICGEGECKVPLAKLCEQTGYKSRNTVSTHLRSLAGKGIIDAVRRVTGTFQVTRAKYGGKETTLEKREYFIKVHELPMQHFYTTDTVEPSWKVSSPVRNDRNPSLVFLTKLKIFKDYATGEIFSKDRMRKICSSMTLLNLDPKLVGILRV